ncbi:MAG: hypothetical protein QXZ47_06415 [Candidatus Bathyarchaeia archaeon]
MEEAKGQKWLEIDDLKRIFISDAYVEELKELSCYGVHIKQERPMCYILAKHLYKQSFDVILEKSQGKNYWYDLVVNGTTIEIKFYYESDLRNRLEKEMNKNQWDLDKLLFTLNSLKREHKSYGWSMTLSILEDVFNKQPDIFILTILSRDLRKKVHDLSMEHICWSKYEIKYNEKYGFNNNSSFKLLERFLESIKVKRNFKLDYTRIDINTLFPSTYHLYFCDFRKAKD